MRQIISEQDLFKALAEEARRIGFDYCAYGMRLPLPITVPKTVMLNSYPANWQVRYITQGYLQIDPTVRHGNATTQPLVWTAEGFDDVSDFWEDARSHGLRHGWSQSSVDPAGLKGMLTFARSGEPISDSELAAKGAQMVWLTQIAHLCMSQLISAKMLPESTITLSLREKLVLQWTADGKTSNEISDIVGISERTVNYHIANVMLKLNCANKTAAVVRAALLGFLTE